MSEPLQLRPATIYRVPRFAYLGAGAKVDELPRWLEFLAKYKWDRYIDLTAGSNNQPYAIHRYFRRDVIVNDVCFYSHLIALGTLLRSDTVPDFTISAAIGAGMNNEKPGKFSKNAEWDVGPHGQRIKLFVDGLTRGLNPKNTAHAFVLACAGSAILKKLTMRSTGQHTIKGKQVDGSIATVKTLQAEIWRKTVDANSCVARPGSHNVALFGTLLEALPKLDERAALSPSGDGETFRGCIVNVDYAWPYESNDNPYYDYLDVSDFLGSPLSRKSFQYWKDESTEQVLTEVVHMTREILKRKPVAFFLWNQTTNRPHPESVLERLQKEKIKAKLAMRIERISTSRKNTFTDVVLEILP